MKYARIALAPIVDVIIFVAALGNGMQLTNAHLLSFGIAAVLNYFVNVRGRGGRGTRGDARLHVLFWW